MSRSPDKILLSFFCHQGIQDHSMVRQGWQEVGNILNKTQEGAHIGCRARNWPVQDFVNFFVVCLNSSGGDVVTQKVNSETKQFSLLRGAVEFMLP